MDVWRSGTVTKRQANARSTENWFGALQEYISGCREALPLAARENLPASEEAHCQIVGGSFLRWLQDTGPQFLSERRVLSKMMKVSPDPDIVFTSNMPGLVAAAEILGDDHDGTAFLLEDEYSHWVAQSPDDEFRWHVHVWSYFRESVEPEFERKAKTTHPLSEGSVYWQHTEGTMWGRLAGRGVDHLWQWDGNQPELLGEAFTHWVT